MDTLKSNKEPQFTSSSKQNYLRITIFFLGLVLCFFPFITPPFALLMGIFVAIFVGHPYLHLNNKATQFLLKISVVGLGFGMNVHSAFNAGKVGFIFTLASIVGTMLTGVFIGRILKNNNKTSYLITSGTAICGGSAIAAISPIIKAEEKQISVALGVVFILNSIALFIFPPLANHFNLNEAQFGLWCAIAIHDTSSVVGAAGKYGAKALEIATTIKLGRALWIIPLAFLSTYIFKNKNSKVKLPFFIGLFVLAMLANSYISVVKEYGHFIVTGAKIGLTITLYLIGCGLSKKVIRSVGVKPLLQATLLWLIVAAVSLWAVMYFEN